MKAVAQLPLRIAIFSRYCLSEQYDLAAEFKGMLADLTTRNVVLHLSMKGRHTEPEVPPGLAVEELSLSIDRHTHRDIILKSLLMYLYLPWIASRLRKFKPDVIYLSEVLPLFGLMLRWLTHTKVTTGYGDWHLHNMLGRKIWSKPFLRMAESLDRFEVRRLDGFLCRADSASARLIGWGVHPSKVRVVRDAPDPHVFFPSDQSHLRLQCGFDKDDIVLLYHGIMHQGKGLDRLLSWTAELYQENHKIGIIMVGKGPEEGHLRQLATDSGLGKRAFFTGWLNTTKEVGCYCNAADICIAMRTADEANQRVVPGALLHSMACRKVIIGPRLEGVAEIIRDGENGYMFTPDDGEDFKRLIHYLIAHRNEWERVSAAAHEDILRNYSVPAAARLYAGTIEHFATNSTVRHAARN